MWELRIYTEEAGVAGGSCLRAGLAGEVIFTRRWRSQALCCPPSTMPLSLAPWILVLATRGVISPAGQMGKRRHKEFQHLLGGMAVGLRLCQSELFPWGQTCMFFVPRSLGDSLRGAEDHG